MQKTTDRVKMHNSLNANLKDMERRIPHVTIERIEESFPELMEQGYVKFVNCQNQKKKEDNFSENVCRKPPQKESVAALEMWNMALKVNQDRKWKEPHICPFCDKSIVTRWSLRRHIRVHYINQVLHTNNKVTNGHTQNPSLRYCSVCGKSFFSKQSLRSHIATHSLQCKFCKKQFTELKVFKAHLESHSPKPSYRCEKCNEMFISQNGLEQHSFMHSTIEAFSCKECQMQFTSEYSLNIHKKQHEVQTYQSNVVLQNNSNWMVIIHSWPSTAS